MRVYVPLSHKVFKEGRELSWRQTRRVPLHHLPQLFKRRLPLGVRERVGGQLHLHSRPSNHSRCFLPLPCSPPHSTVRASATLSPATLSGPVPLCLPQHCPGQRHSVSRNTVRSSVMSVSCNTVRSSVMSVSRNTVRSSATLSHATLSAEDRTIQYVSRDCFVLCPFTPTTLARLLRLSSLSSSSCNVHVCLTL